ncbi:diflavin flavoprotein a 2-related [Anaeramoeba ignava]|uniref:Diflavin flavoprotein a 2-related n=1 Tax=Anaeramoeba ignava TaxID=1746090 RepID=A0A9Q0R6E2_ANAIG|nr:diflavin flavoprotein a 2-related [Anaeramoeba ignava]
MTNLEEEKSFSAIEIKKDLYFVGALDPKLKFFDVVIPCPFGTTYNAFLLKGSQKIALIETVKNKTEFFKQLKNRIDSVLLNGEKIDYIIHNHTEPDHSGSFYQFLQEKCPNASVIATKPGIENLKNLVPDHAEKIKFLEADERLIIRLGGYTLSFIKSPLLHWPDTMFTYCKEMETIFTCDFFGAHYCSSKIFNDLLDKEEKEEFNKEVKHYFDSIMSPFKKAVKEGLKNISSINFNTICCAHGPIIRQEIENYKRNYSEWSQEKPKKDKIVIAYISSYGFTEKMGEIIENGIKSIKNGKIEVKRMNAAEKSVEEIMTEISDSKGLLLGSPTVMGDASPLIMRIANELNPLIYNGDPKNRMFAGCFGSYGWSGEATENLSQRLLQVRMRIPLPPLKIHFKMSSEEEQNCFEWGALFADCVLEKEKADTEFAYKFGKKQTSIRKLLNSAEMGSDISVMKRYRAPKQDGKIKKWKCVICGEIIYDVAPPAFCPACGAPQEVFVLVEEIENYQNSTDENNENNNNENNQANKIKFENSLENMHQEYQKIQSQKEYEGHIVVIGASAAGVSAVKSIREVNRRAKITLISAENHIPYYRPSLTKTILSGQKPQDDSFYLTSHEWLLENNIQFFQNFVVTNINLKKKVLVFEHNKQNINSDKKKKNKKQQISFDRIILAVGSNQKLPQEKRSFLQKLKKRSESEKILNEARSQKVNVFGFRTIDDSLRIKEYIEKNAVETVIIFGSGPLGMEIFDGLQKLNVKKISFVESRKRILASRVDDEGSALLQKILKSNGARLYLGYEMHHILDNSNNKKDLKVGKKADNVAHGIALEKVDTTHEEILKIYGDLVIFATGVYAETTLAKKIGLKIQRGIIVDSLMNTSEKDVFACGDCVEYKGFNEKSWRNAIITGKVAGLASVNIESSFHLNVSPYSVTVCGLIVYCMGDTNTDNQEVISSLSKTEAHYVKLFFKEIEGRTVLCGGIIITFDSSIVVTFGNYLEAQMQLQPAVKRLISYTRDKQKKKRKSKTSVLAKFQLAQDLIPDLNALFHLQGGYEKFREFLKEQLCEENLDFWTEAENYSRIPNGHESQIEVANQIYNQYVRYGAEKEINIDHFCRVEVTEKIRYSEISQDLFKTSQQQIMDLLQSDHFKRFVKSPAAKFLVSSMRNLREQLEDELKEN